MTIRATECIARETIAGQIDEILGYANPTNDGNLAAWMVAKDRAQRMVGTLDTVCRAIAARPSLGPGHAALRAIAAEIPVTDEEEAEFQRIEAAHPITFAPLEHLGREA